jgi:hypothetical protein
MTKGLAAALASGVLLASVPGCTSTDKELSLEQTRRQEAWTDLVSAPRQARPRSLGWTEALDQMRTRNAKMLSADLDVTRAAEALDQVKKSIIPTASFTAGYDRFFSSAANASFEPFTFAANLFFDVPGLFSYRVRYEAAILTLTHARLARESTWRGQVVALYRAALESAELRDRSSRLAGAEAALASLSATAPEAAEQERGELADRHRQLAKLQADWLGRAQELLGLPGVDITLAVESLPPLPYDRPSDRPAPERLAQLPLRVAALDLLALRARQLGITLQQWPEIDMEVSSPTVYQTGSGQTSTWSPRELFAGVNSFWTLDTQGKHASDKRLLAGESAYRREVLAQEAAAAAAKLRTALDGLAETDRRLEAVDRALSSPEAPLKPALIAAREELATDRREWRLTLWFFDDARWAGDTPRT